MRGWLFRALLCAVCVAEANSQPCTPFWSDRFAAGPTGGGPYALAVFDDDGPGPNPAALYAAGNFTAVNGATARLVARWDGQNWSPLGSGMELSGAWGVTALAVYDEDGDGPNPARLFLAGNFRVTIDGQTITTGLVRWDGSAYSLVGTGLSGLAASLLVWDEDGAGPMREALHVGGVTFTLNGNPVRGVVKWDGLTWSGMGFSNQWSWQPVYGGAMAAFDEDGAGPGPEHLYFLGACRPVQGVLQGIARWTGAEWEPIPGFLPGDFGNALHVFDEDGAGPLPAALFLAGHFDFVGGVTARSIARWDGTAWTALTDDFFPSLWGLEVFDEDGAGGASPMLYATGEFGFLRRWDGTTWTTPGVGSLTPSASAQGLALLVHEQDNAPALFVGGGFTGAFGVPSQAVAAYVGCADACPGDVDGDEVVGLGDLTVLLSHFGQAEGATSEDGDLDADGDVDLGDLSLLLGAFGSVC